MRKRILSTIMAACMGLTVLISPISNMSSVVAKEQPAQAQQVVAQPQEVYISFEKDLGNGAYSCYITSLIEFNKSDILKAKSGGTVKSICGNTYPVVDVNTVMKGNGIKSNEFKNLQKQEGYMNLGIANPAIINLEYDMSDTGYYFLKEKPNGNIVAVCPAFGPAFENSDPYGDKLYNLVLAPQATVDYTSYSFSDNSFIISGAEFCTLPKGKAGAFDSTVFKGVEVLKPVPSGCNLGAYATVLNGVIISMKVCFWD